MSQFADLAAELENLAEEAWSRAEAAGKQLVQELVPVIEDGLQRAVEDFGALACDLVLKFMQQEFESWSGREKHGNVVAGLIQEAEAKGKALAIADAQALAKNVFLAVVAKAPG